LIDVVSAATLFSPPVEIVSVTCTANSAAIIVLPLRYRLLLAVGLIVFVPPLLGGCSAAATPPVVPHAPASVAAAPATQVAAPAAAYECRFTEQPIAIDGSLDDVAWKDAATIDNFSMPWLGKDNKSAAKATRAKIIWDRENLYVSADLDDSDLYADITEHDGQI
jgi:Carbohydrate family 9 binding domain-like